MAPQFYWFPVSPFARYVRFFALEAGIELEVHNVNLLAGEHKTEKYLKEVNENGKVPALVDGDLQVWESHAIVRYLSRKKETPLYPNGDIKQVTIIDRTVETLHNRFGSAAVALFFELVAKKLFTKVGPDVDIVKKHVASVHTHLKDIENLFFKDSEDYLVGTSFTLADVYLATYISQIMFVNFDLSPFPKVKKFYEATRKRAAFVESHTEAEAIAASIAANPDLAHLKEIKLTL
eukprot:CAMPEP_0177663076 /NCGR_PEP_ID=MMETSP0447-20121125/19718_1 /TAXON_ID=0 /ORGANISM="Stygamoeba regulata, Strain BSH-02190019" /LENGTH=234 /DNA_ID=CAMNT_0019168859 /DNA_START=58 /DNA_END=762 /DNA_ORIENTATION=+